MVFNVIAALVRRVIWQFDITREFKGVKLPQTAAAGIISTSKELIYKFAALKGLENKLNSQIAECKSHTTVFKRMKAPEPGAKGAKLEKHASKYHGRRKKLLSAVSSITTTINLISREFNAAVKKLTNITFDSQIILFQLEHVLNGVLRRYHQEYRRMRSRGVGTMTIKGFADRVNNIQADFKSELRRLWEASKAQERKVPSQYIVEEWSLRGNIPVLRYMKKFAIDVGHRTMAIAGVNPMNIKDVETNSKNLIQYNAKIQKYVKILMRRLDHLLNRIQQNFAFLDKKTKKRLSRPISKSRRKWNSAARDITAQSRRLFLDVRVKPVYIKVEKPAAVARPAA